jgi:hypothetical protein
MSIPDTPMSSLLALLQNAEQTPPLKLLMEQWLLAHPVSDILTELEIRAQMLEIHAQDAIHRGDIHRGHMLSVLVAQIRVRIQAFTSEVEAWAAAQGKKQHDG